MALSWIHALGYHFIHHFTSHDSILQFKNSTKYINIFIVAAEIIDNKESIV